VVVEATGPERTLYAELSDFLREGCRTGRDITRMLAQAVQMELGSSPRAAAATLGRLLERTPWPADIGDALRRFRDQADDLVADSKSRALLNLLRAWNDKLLVFTRFRATQEHVRASYARRARTW
jgi:phosphoserine phosphatase